MANTTISISKQFQDWLKSKGTKGESYESIILKLIRAEALEEYHSNKPVASTPKDSKGPEDIVDTMFEGKLE